MVETNAEGAGQTMDMDINPFERWDAEGKAASSLMQNMQFDTDEFMGVVLSKSMELMKFDGPAPWDQQQQRDRAAAAPPPDPVQLNPDPFGSTNFSLGNFSAAFNFNPSPRGSEAQSFEPVIVPPFDSSGQIQKLASVQEQFRAVDEGQFRGVNQGQFQGVGNSAVVPNQFSSAPLDPQAQFRVSLVDTLARLAAAKQDESQRVERFAFGAQVHQPAVQTTMTALLNDDNTWQVADSGVQEPPRKLTPQKARPMSSRADRQASPPPSRTWIKLEDAVGADTVPDEGGGTSERKHSGSKRSLNGIEKVEPQAAAEAAAEAAARLEKSRQRTQRQKDKSKQVPEEAILDPKEIERLEKSRLKAQRHREKVKQWKEEVSEKLDHLEKTNAALLAERDELVAEKAEWDAERAQWAAERARLEADKAQAEADSGRLWNNSQALAQVLNGVSQQQVSSPVPQQDDSLLLPEASGDTRKMQEEIVRLREENRTMQSELELIRGALIAQSRTMSDLMALRQVARGEEGELKGPGESVDGHF